MLYSVCGLFLFTGLTEIISFIKSKLSKAWMYDEVHFTAPEQCSRTDLTKWAYTSLDIKLDLTLKVNLTTRDFHSPDVDTCK